MPRGEGLPVSLKLALFFMRQVWDNAYRNKETPWRGDIGWVPGEIGTGRGAWAIDIGCGTGEAAFLLEKKGYKVVGIDFSEEAIKIGRKEAKRRKSKVVFRVDDAEEYLEQIVSGKRKFQLVLDSKVYAFIKNKEKYIENVSRIIKKNGLFIVQGFLRDSKRGICVSQKDINILLRHFDPIKQDFKRGKNRESFMWLMRVR